MVFIQTNRFMKELKIRLLRIYKPITFLLFVTLFIIPTAIFAQNYPTITAQKGDGIYSVLKDHGLDPGKYLNKFIELNKSKLGKNNSLYAGVKYRLPIPDDMPSTTKSTKPEENVSKAAPSSSAHVVTKLYGSKYEKVAIIDNSLKGAVFYLVSGHGGPDPGAIGYYGNNMLCEDEYAYDVTLRLSRALEERGATVYMIIQDPNDGIRDDRILKADKTEVCYPKNAIPRNQISRLRQRKDAVNKLYIQNKGRFQRLVVIHVDSRSKGENIDVFFYHDKRSKSGKKLADNLQQTFKEKYDYHQPNRGYHGTVSSRNLYMLKYSYPAAVFIELGNINHKRDQTRFMMENNRQALANWLADGLIKDYKRNK